MPDRERKEHAVSELIGAILLVGLVITAMAIVAVLLLSNPPPEEVPQVNAIAGNETDPVNGDEYIYLLHNGGDPLTPLETVIRIDGGRDPGTIEISTEDGSYEPWTSGEWSVGKTLRITDDQPPQSVTLIYSGGSSQALLLTSTFVETASGGGGGPEPPELWTITASAGSGGSISPSGPVQVPDGGSQSFSISPDECYSIANVVVDGSNLGFRSSYQFTNVQEDHTIQASFTENSFFIDASVDGGGGTIDPSGIQGPYDCHESETFSITANPGYNIQDVVVDGISQGPVSIYPFDDIVKNHAIVASFSPEPGPDCGTISGYKWNDLNGNGVRDTSDPGLSGWTIKASECIQGNCNNLGAAVSTITDASGYYIFSGLTYQPATLYRVQETLQAGWSATSPSGGFKDIKLEPPGSGGQPAKCYESNMNFGNRAVQPPTANFQGAPTTGAAPLQVQFTDISTGNLTQWQWDINNDGVIDYTIQNPLHTYTTAGTYSVRLTVTGSGGSNTLIRTNYITVTTPQTTNIYLNANKDSALQSGGYIQFRVTGPYSYIRHGSTYYALNNGDTVKLEITNDGTGNIYATSNTINDFRFSNVKLWINGNDKGTRDIGGGDIWISSYDSYLSTLTLIVPTYNSWTQLLVNGVWVIYGQDNRGIQILNLRPDTFGVMNLNSRTDTFYNGGATGYQLI